MKRFEEERNKSQEEKTSEENKKGKDVGREKQEEKNEEQEESKEKQKLEKSTKQKIWAVIRELAIYVLIIITCLYFVPTYVAAKNLVDGESMERTLQHNDQVITEKVSYRFHNPKRFDVIIFYHFDDFENQNKKDTEAYDFYVKRIIGLPGERVQIIEDTIYINGKPIEEHFGKDPIQDPGRAEEEILLGEDEYFVLGDNREVSIDSRDERVGNVKRDWIYGRVCARIYPFSKIGGIS